MKKRPVTTLFLLSSVDGKISTGASDELDVDTDYPRIRGVREGLFQYYEIEKTTDLWSLNSGRVQAKLGVNKKAMPEKTPVSFVVIDNKNLTEHGVRYFCCLSKEFVLITTNKKHPAFCVQADNLHIICQDTLDLREALSVLYGTYGCERITVQTGGTLNAMFLREKLLDRVDIVFAPVLVGGKETASVIDGEALVTQGQLSRLGVLELEKCDVLAHSYVRLRYKVIR